jgi:hypothetical protein
LALPRLTTYQPELKIDLTGRFSASNSILQHRLHTTPAKARSMLLALN